jgi:metallo-beta-lactamase class B
MALMWGASFVQPGSRLQPDPPIKCDSCAAWNAPIEPFRVFGNTYYVGVAGLSAVLVTSNQGLILFDGDLPQSAAMIDANIRKLGFRTEDVRFIANSHAHFDHAGGINALQRLSGATVVASAAGATALQQGGLSPDDPQFGMSDAETKFPRVPNVRVIADGEVVRVGDLAVTAHLTPGHTVGSTTWTWRSCEDGRCLDIVYADSLNSVSASGFRFTGDDKHPSRVASFRRSIATVGELPCDILLSVHPEFSNMKTKLDLRKQGATTNPFIDPRACRGYAAAAASALDKRVAEEK